MPLVERYGDWTIDDGSCDDPHTLGFDHRLDCGGEILGRGGLQNGCAGAESNMQATCLITTLDASYGWTEAEGGDWIYDPTAASVPSLPTLGAHFDRNVRLCVDHDRRNVLDTLVSNEDPSKNVSEANVMEALREMSWPADDNDPRTAYFVSRFPPERQYIAGPEWASGYHLGGGVVATAGHCLQARVVKNELHTLKVVFGWSGDVRKKYFAANQVFSIKKVMLCDAPDKYRNATDYDCIAQWARQWDNAVFQLKGTLEQFHMLKKTELASQPPRFGSSVYNTGHPLGTPMKVSHKSHVLRHALFNGNISPFAHDIDSGGTYSTDLDQFPGNSGGPVFDGLTAKVVGHTVSTQSAVSESSIADIETWEEKFLSDSRNYQIATEIINPYLARRHPLDPAHRVHPKFLRSLSGEPGGGALFLNTTFICLGDIGPNRVLQRGSEHQVVFNRHNWDSLDVVFRNLTGRIDRIYLFTRPLGLVIAEFPDSTLRITITGDPTTFHEPSNTTISITVGAAEWHMCLTCLVESYTNARSEISYLQTIDLSTTFTDSPIPPPCLSAPFGLASWTRIRLSQPTCNPPASIGLEMTIRKAPFAFPPDQRWPPDRLDVTRDEDLEWPAEDFRFSTSVGNTEAATQRDEGQPSKAVMRSDGDRWEWVADIDRVWRDPGQLE